MKYKIGFSTGAFYTWHSDINKQISLIKKLKLKAIELSFINVDELNYVTSDENIHFLKSIDYASLHAPIFDSSRKKISICESKDILNKLKDIYLKINAKIIVFHPDIINDWDLIARTGMNIGVENLPAEDKYDNYKLKELFNKYPKFSLVLDTAHAFSCESPNLQELIKLFKKKICHVHFSDRRFSNVKGRLRDHEQFLFCSDREKFSQVKSLNCPIIIEVSIKDKKYDLVNIREEIDSVQDFLSK